MNLNWFSFLLVSAGQRYILWNLEQKILGHYTTLGPRDCRDKFSLLHNVVYHSLAISLFTIVLVRRHDYSLNFFFFKLGFNFLWTRKRKKKSQEYELEFAGGGDGEGKGIFVVQSEAQVWINSIMVNESDSCIFHLFYIDSLRSLNAQCKGREPYHEM